MTILSVQNTDDDKEKIKNIFSGGTVNSLQQKEIYEIYKRPS